MNRRDFLRSTGAAALAAPLLAESWRTFEVTTRVEVLNPSGETRIWIPAALRSNVPFQKRLADEFKAEGGSVSYIQGPAPLVAAKFPSGVKPVITLTSWVMTQPYSVNLSTPASVRSASRAELEQFLQPTKLLPTDGIVKTTADAITIGAQTDLAKARAIYNWIVENTTRNPKTLGCGRGDIRFMLESKDLSGKCADINSLFVGLARASGLPARDVFGIRTAKSQLGYKSMGASSENVTKAQHCRAEVYVSRLGWIPVDPADVRKVMMEEPALADAARERLFGSWEMNWMAYNFGHDVPLSGSSGSPVAFLMYPQAETAEGRLNSLDASSFRYEISTREIGD